MKAIVLEMELSKAFPAVIVAASSVSLLSVGVCPEVDARGQPLFCYLLLPPPPPPPPPLTPPAAPPGISALPLLPPPHPSGPEPTRVPETGECEAEADRQSRGVYERIHHCQTTVFFITAI